VSYMYGYFKWFGLNFGIELHYYTVFVHICPITSVLTLLSFHCRFECGGPTYRWEVRSWGQLSQEEFQRKPNRPNTGNPMSKPAIQKEYRTHRSRRNGTAVVKGHHGLAVVLTTDSAGGRTAVRPCTSEFFHFLRGCSFFRALFQFVLMFWL